MSKSKKVIPLVDPEVQASCLFSEHVQSIAFNLTLSRRMIAFLQVIRDSQSSRLEFSTQPATISSNGAHQFLRFEYALARRGLVIFKYRKFGDPPDFEPTAKLSKIGTMVCELLVECGLMPAQKTNSTRKAV